MFFPLSVESGAKTFEKFVENVKVVWGTGGDVTLENKGKEEGHNPTTGQSGLITIE